MIFWADNPPEQWIYVEREKHHEHPWSVIVGASVRARCTTATEAHVIANGLIKAFKSAVNEGGAHDD